MPSTQQWKRVCEVVVGDATAGTGIAMKDLRIEFDVCKTIGHTPNTALIKIRNLAPENEAKIKGEFTEILLNAGYEGQSRLIFAGNIKHTSRYRDGNDYVMEIEAADGDDDLRNTVVNSTLAAGTTISQAVDHLVSKFTRVKLGHAVLKDRARIRGRVMSGSAKTYFDQIAKECDANWSIQDGRLEIVPVASTLPTEAIVIRADTGMVKAPELGDKGIKVTCLLNPQIRVNGKVQLDNNDFKIKVLTQRKKKVTAGVVQPATTKSKGPKVLARLDPDGIYKVFKLTHKGDNRGNDWTTEIECLALAKTIPAGKQAA
jgi:hypothetical protein